jgi:hypothetical protein
MKPISEMTMQELHDHVLNHPEHNAPVVLTQMGASMPKRWHFQHHKEKLLTHDHNIYHKG